MGRRWWKTENHLSLLEGCYQIKGERWSWCGLSRLGKLGLLPKWGQWLKSGGNSFWHSCIKSIHNTLPVDGEPILKIYIQGFWLNISQSESDLDNKGIHFRSLFGRMVGIRDKTHFWKDIWCADNFLKVVSQIVWIWRKIKII